MLFLCRRSRIFLRIDGFDVRFWRTYNLVLGVQTNDSGLLGLYAGDADCPISLDSVFGECSYLKANKIYYGCS